MADSLKLKNRRVTVMGLGLHGGAVGTVKWLYGQGAKVLVTDLKGEEGLEESLEKLESLEDVEYVLGEHREKDFIDTHMVVRNPGVPGDSKYLDAAREAGVQIEMDSSLFFKYCPSQDVIGITGSKGKTTTAHAIAHLLKAAEKKVVAVGVDGVSPLNELDNITADTTVVFELSSWRLEALNEMQISPAVAVVTSLYPDHLNTYKSFEDYIGVKKAIIKYQGKDGAVILNYDDELVRQWTSGIRGKLYWYGMGLIPETEDGIYVNDSWVWARKDGISDKVFPISELSGLDERRARNVLPAILLAQMRGVKINKRIGGLVDSMKTMPHRLERVDVVDGVTYINDTTATIPEATIAGLKSLDGERIVLILGGGDKMLSYKKLVQEVSQSNVKVVVFLPGSATDRMADEIKKTGVQIIKEGDMKRAVRQASAKAEKGDVVLLSPAATSFGLFKHEFDRGEQFRQIVSNLK